MARRIGLFGFATILTLMLSCGGGAGGGQATPGPSPTTEPSSTTGPVPSPTPEPPKGFIVNSLADTWDAAVGDGVCATPERECTLHAALQEQASSSTLPLISLATTGTIRLASPLPPLTGGVTIVGPGADALAIVGQSEGPVFRISGNAEIRGITISGGSEAGIVVESGAVLTATQVRVSDNRAGGRVYQDGGGIVNHGTLTLNASIVAQNTAHIGGGILNLGQLLVADSLVTGNTAGDDPRGSATGGGIASSGSLTIRGSRILANHAGNGGGVYSTGELLVEDSQISENIVPSERGVTRHGGGLYLSGSAQIVRSWIIGNTASYGGGIFKNPDASLEITGSFIANNAAATSGGGLLNNRGPLVLDSTTITGNQGVGLTNNRGSATVTNVTISGNSGNAIENRGVSGDAGSLVIAHTTIAGNGGGVLTDGSSQPLLRASILQNNGSNCIGLIGEQGGAVGAVQSQGANISSDSSCRLAAAGDRSGTNPRMGPLGDNGGGSPTHALAPDSPAIDAAGDCGLPTDQRGLPRPQVGIPGGVPACDSGAFELQ